MTDKEFRRLNRRELLKLLLAQSKEVERLKKQLQQANEQLESRTLLVREAGSIAEAAVRVNQIFETAQKTADQYLESVYAMAEKQSADSVVADAQRKCEAMYQDTKRQCDEMLEQARMGVQRMKAQEQQS